MEELIKLMYEEIESLKARVESLEKSSEPVKQTKKKSTRESSDETKKARTEAQRLIKYFTDKYSIEYIYLGEDVTNIGARVKKHKVEELMEYFDWAWKYLKDDDFMSKHLTIGFLFQAKHFNKYYNLYNEHKESLRIKSMASQMNTRAY